MLTAPPDAHRKQLTINIVASHIELLPSHIMTKSFRVSAVLSYGAQRRLKLPAIQRGCDRTNKFLLTALGPEEAPVMGPQ
jgi:hypothetical protein